MRWSEPDWLLFGAAVTATGLGAAHLIGLPGFLIAGAGAAIVIGAWGGGEVNTEAVSLFVLAGLGAGAIVALAWRGLRWANDQLAETRRPRWPRAYGPDYRSQSAAAAAASTSR